MLSCQLFVTALVTISLLVMYRQQQALCRLSKCLASSQSELSSVRERYEVLTRNIPAAVLITTPVGSLCYASPYTESLTGYSPAQFAEANDDLFRLLVLPEDEPRYSRGWLVSQLGEDMVVRCQIRHQKGIVLWLETHFVPLFDEAGAVTAVLRVCVDITAAVRHQQHVEEQNRELNDFAAMISHDLKAPIFTIQGMAHTLREEQTATISAAGQEHLGYILSAAKRLESLVESILEYSTVSTKYLDETDVPLCDILQSVADDLAEQIRTLHAQIHVPAELPHVRGEPVRIYQVFANLLGNALKYAAPNVTPEITVSTKDISPHWVELSVHDNGLGIAADKLEEIFRPYRRACNRQIQGNGIGLACVKKIVERLGGAVRVESTEGTGSTFRVTLPRSSNSTSLSVGGFDARTV